MNVPLLFASVALAGAALFDGISTVHFLKNPAYRETNWLLGPRPSALRVYAEGGALVGSEVIAASALNHLSVYLGYALAAAAVYQIYVHVRNGIKNFKIAA